MLQNSVGKFKKTAQIFNGKNVQKETNFPC